MPAAEWYPSVERQMDTWIWLFCAPWCFLLDVGRLIPENVLNPSVQFFGSLINEFEIASLNLRAGALAQALSKYTLDESRC